ncbi:MAG: bifunctional tRNA (5-methylaminomethyl-2-thiouridine)(34)-methyltransferase MnmD/FAD-dependent 5-carboxymethylaminomethyl-2-thiouridine(34) oxidoreductase MnmC, partial [Thalassotalea sp.]|nr:bifunctional tRNA (5-methylaminomethyl-2-thiouridine)(34)-methyltransferase MnmD/FAD-dependent 5-carboxymethylaminomethyl-2-thiouridine(34) oxidoreductase MnmC [Thalassotalea sp.]
SDILTRKARLRCMTPDHLPMVGAVPDLAAHISTYAHLSKDKNWRFYQAAPTIKNLYVLTGLGARGLCTAPLLAEILLADLTGKPYPVDNDMLFNLSPNRFIIRDLIKRKTSAEK